jgi:hypothetical protein
MTLSAPLGLAGERMPAVGLIGFNPSAGVVAHAHRMMNTEPSSTHKPFPDAEDENCIEVASEGCLNKV